ncbi:hypothetical protein PGTUg99_023942 [Puccinia graminis f. sp. tritici]|uniref:Small ribosomal subunit protein mS38 n=1 Tax=Puccinia graminis f. sp. tritici TaxID=56615 RepID=A0A5B0NL59_PUCGR|nr:hypothetical protein PGTUg99_023942 [Puccinia graminis f. sp. tritici]
MLSRIRPSSILSRTSFKPTHWITPQTRPYSSASDRKPKSDGTIDSDPDHQITTTTDKKPDHNKPIVISGRGRRASHRSTQSRQYGFIPPKLALPFKPLSSNHLAHLRPTTLFLDLFFSLQRPLLEIELGPNERRSISFESKQSKLQSEADPELSASSVQDSQDDDLDYPHLSSGSPSDPAFKPPHPSSARPAPDENELDDQIWSTSDPYSAYLIAEPDGVHPAWSDALKRCLANSQAFVPPPEPKPKQETTNTKAPTPEEKTQQVAGGQSLRTSQSENETQTDRDRQRALKFLNPYGSTTEQPSPEDQSGSSTGESNTLPQDQLSLTMQAARFLHSGMMSNRWPSAVNWAAIDSRLTAATESYTSSETNNGEPGRKLADFSGSFPAIRGQERAIHSGRRSRPGHASRHRILSAVRGDPRDGQTFSFNTEQLTQIIKYSQRIIKDKLNIDAIPKSILQNLERFGEFLIHKHFKNGRHPSSSASASAAKPNPTTLPGSSITPIVIIDPSAPTHQSSVDPPGIVINFDSVFRKKKRKMKVHKYKKRRKARRTLKKRQGK